MWLPTLQLLLLEGVQEVQLQTCSPQASHSILSLFSHMQTLFFSLWLFNPYSQQVVIFLMPVQHWDFLTAFCSHTSGAIFTRSSEMPAQHRKLPDSSSAAVSIHILIVPLSLSSVCSFLALHSIIYSMHFLTQNHHFWVHLGYETPWSFTAAFQMLSRLGEVSLCWWSLSCLHLCADEHV